MSGEALLPYRPNVGAVLFNLDGRVFVARRADLPNAEGAAGGWQLPQGGIDPGRIRVPPSCASWPKRSARLAPR